MSEKKSVVPPDLIGNPPYDFSKLEGKTNMLFVNAEIPVPEALRGKLEEAIAQAYHDVVGHPIIAHPWVRMFP